MNVVIPVLAIAVVGGTATILTEPSPAPRGPSTGVSFFDDAAGQAQGLPDTSVTVGGDDLTTLVEVTEQLASLTGLQVTGDWEVLVDLGVSKDLELEIEVRDQRLPIALRAIERALPGQPAARWVLSGEALLLTSDEAADRIEARLATYEIERVLDHIMDRDSLDPDEARDALRGLIYQFVEPDSWREMGGDAAQLSVVGGKLFVEAPDRMHARIRWILDELTPVDEEARLGRPGARIGAPGAGGGFGSAQDYDTMLRPGDLVTVEIYGLYELDEWFRLSRRVDEAGVLRLPELGDVPAAGRTRAVLEDDLHGRLTEFISNPRCLVKLESEVSAR